jgi:hypothetical protein
MKKLITILLVFSFWACDEDESKSPLSGEWLFSTIDQDASKPKLNATFRLIPSGSNYTVENLTVAIDGTNSEGFISQIEASGNELKTMVLTNGSTDISLYSGVYLTTGWVYIDSVIYKTDTERHKYLGQRFLHP